MLGEKNQLLVKKVNGKISIQLAEAVNHSQHSNKESSSIRISETPYHDLIDSPMNYYN